MNDHGQDDGRTEKKHDPEMPPAGPHARPELTNPDLTPGSGILPGGADDPNPQPTS